jgi:dolichyl-phosphate mannosyltransferase polypeptide 2 regulatory subunit
LGSDIGENGTACYDTLLTRRKPFFPQAHPIHGYFLSREWALRIPAFILVLGMSVIGLFVGSVISTEKKKKDAKNKQAKAN